MQNALFLEIETITSTIRRMNDPPEYLVRIRKAVEPLLRAESKARELSNQIPSGVLFVGLSGVRLEEPSYEILPELLILRQITNPPGMAHVCRAADQYCTDYLAVARYSDRISAEIVAGNPASSPEDKALPFLVDLAWHVAVLLKLRGAVGIFAPACATASWDTIAARVGRDVVFTMLDDVPRQTSISGQQDAIFRSDIEWIAQNFEPALRLRDFKRSRRFALAYNVSYTWNHSDNPRLALANLWVGIESLFGDRADRGVRKALVERVSAWLPGIRAEDVGHLYDYRCDAVHGRWLENSDMMEPVRESWELLRSSVLQAIERRAAPLVDWGEPGRARGGSGC